ncbi:MAG TPA: pilus assembly protein N-terminal domain-containing protein [Vicinamibacterales bacterium]|nr:pilus assembly protein N-terminal domain-containing protein [Vicinamibacterales bacterium]
MTGQQKWAAACGVPMFIIGVFGTPHATLAQVAPGPTVTAALPAGAIPGPGAEALADPSSVRLLVGRSTLVDVGAPISRVSLTSADVADALVTSPNQLLVHGKVPGSISMFVWNRGGSVKRYEIVVQRDLAALAEQMKTLFPGEAIQVHSNGKQVVLSGNASRKEIADKAMAVAAGYVDKKEDVVNLLASQPGPAASQVLLRVRFAEVSRNALTELGASFFTSPTGIKNTVGRTTTQQFSAPTFSDMAWTKENGDFGSPVTSAEGKLNFSDFLNLFFLNQKYDLGVVIKAMQQRGLFQSLAEPNLVAQSGKEASFLAGGEIPIPIAQGSGANLAISVQYKEYGVRLNFTPTVNGDRVHLKVKPEVSTLDFGNSVVMNGFRIPALSTRRTETEIELRNGQTFAIAGLLSNQMQSTMQKIPGIGDIPILGLLFRSKAAQKNQTELVVMITPEILPPDSPGVTPNLPRMPETFMAPVSDRQLKPTPPPAFTTRPRSQADNANGTAPAAPVVIERSAIDRAQDQARQQLEREEQARAAAAAAAQPVEAPRAAAKPADVRRAAEKQAHAEAKQHAVEQKRMDAMQREQAKKDAEAAAKAQKEEARRAAADRTQAEKLAQEQAKQDAVAAKQKAKADKQAAEAAKKRDAEAKRNGQEARGQADVLQERQRAIDAAAERLRASEAEYQAELAKRSAR